MRILSCCLLELLLVIALLACGTDISGLREAFDAPCGPACVPSTCSALVASEFHWSLNGFRAQDILNPDVRNQPELTAIMHMGDVKTLKVSAGTTRTSEDCSGKATSVEWSVSNPVVARLDITDDPRTRSLVALQPGDTGVAAILTFQDGTPPIRVLPWSFTNVGSGDISVVRVVP
jgi:hypothetical protein